MSINNKRSALAFMSMAMMMGADTTFRDAMAHEEKSRKNVKKQPVIPANHKRFDYGENHVYALSQKRADKKAIALGYPIAQITPTV